MWNKIPVELHTETEEDVAPSEYSDDTSAPAKGVIEIFGRVCFALLLAAVDAVRSVACDLEEPRVCGRFPREPEAVPSLDPSLRRRAFCSRCWPTVWDSWGLFQERFALIMARVL